MSTETGADECSGIRHGTRSARYRHGCRCPEARRAQTRYYQARTLGRAHLVADVYVDATGARHRIRALYAMGWPERELARGLGYSNGRIPWMSRGNSIRLSTLNKARALCDQLWNTPGPCQRLREQCDTAEKRRQLGWWLMIEWEGVDIDDPHAQPIENEPNPHEVDETAVYRAVTGERPVVFRQVDRRAAVRFLVCERDWSSEQIAVVIRVPERTVDRDRAALGIRRCDLNRQARSVPSAEGSREHVHAA